MAPTPAAKQAASRRAPTAGPGGSGGAALIVVRPTGAPCGGRVKEGESSGSPSTRTLGPATEIAVWLGTAQSASVRSLTFLTRLNAVREMIPSWLGLMTTDI